ncbi:MAG: hypothetical protein AAF363_18620 [Bacteroidota bacterium]
MSKKKNLMTAEFKSLLLILLFSSSIALASRDIAETKRVNLSYSVSSSKDISIEGYETVLEIESWDKQEVEIIAEVNYSGKENKSVRKFLDNFEEHVKSGITDAGSTFKIDTKLSDPKKINVGFGSVQFLSIDYGDKELSITYFIKVPKSNDISVENKYSDIIMNGEYSGDVDIEQYSGDLDAENFNSDVQLELKYGEGKIKSVNTSTLELYEQKLQIGESKKLDLGAKYSTVEIAYVEESKINTYESKLEVKRGGSVEGEMKYGSFTVEDELNESILDLYEVDLDFGIINKLTLEESKYCEIEIKKAIKLDFKKSYEDELEAEILSELIADSKYTDFKIGLLERSLKLNSYEGDIEIDEIGQGFENFDLKGKYNELNIDLGSKTSINLSANLKYGKFEYPESRYSRKVYIKENDNIKAELESKGATDKVVTLNIEGYDSKINIR